MIKTLNFKDKRYFVTTVNYDTDTIELDFMDDDIHDHMKIRYICHDMFRPWISINAIINIIDENTNDKISYKSNNICDISVSMTDGIIECDSHNNESQVCINIENRHTAMNISSFSKMRKGINQYCISINIIVLKEQDAKEFDDDFLIKYNELCSLINNRFDQLSDLVDPGQNKKFDLTYDTIKKIFSSSYIYSEIIINLVKEIVLNLHNERDNALEIFKNAFHFNGGFDDIVNGKEFLQILMNNIEKYHPDLIDKAEELYDILLLGDTVINDRKKLNSELWFNSILYNEPLAYLYISLLNSYNDDEDVVKLINDNTDDPNILTLYDIKTLKEAIYEKYFPYIDIDKDTINMDRWFDLLTILKPLQIFNKK